MAPSKLRTSQEIYDQIRWDPRLDPARFVIGYESRRPEPDEVPLLEFDPEGEIPWHRVLYVRDDRGPVWDRHRRLDELAPGGRLSRAPASPASASADPARPGLVPREPGR